MRKKILSAILISALLFITGCNESTSKHTPEASAINVFVSVFPSSDESKYQALAIIKDNYDDSYLSDAVVTVAGTNVPVYTGGAITSSYKDLPALTPGSSVQITVTQPQLGTIDKTLTVPATVTSIATPTGLANWVARTQKTLDLSWTGGPTGTGYYFQVGIISYYDPAIQIGTLTPTPTPTDTVTPTSTPTPTPTPVFPNSGETFGPTRTSYVGSPINIDENISNMLLNSTIAAVTSGRIITSVKIRVRGVNYIALPEYFDGSLFQVAGKKGENQFSIP